MKNKLFKFSLFFLIICNISLADQFSFETSKIDSNLFWVDLIKPNEGRLDPGKLHSLTHPFENHPKVGKSF